MAIPKPPTPRVTPKPPTPTIQGRPRRRGRRRRAAPPTPAATWIQTAAQAAGTGTGLTWIQAAAQAAGTTAGYGVAGGQIGPAQGRGLLPGGQAWDWRGTLANIGGPVQGAIGRGLLPLSGWGQYGTGVGAYPPGTEGGADILGRGLGVAGAIAGAMMPALAEFEMGRPVLQVPTYGGGGYSYTPRRYSTGYSAGGGAVRGQAAARGMGLVNWRIGL